MDLHGEVSYNDRLFSKGFRRRLHLARYYWVVEKLKSHHLSPKSVLELGCYDGKLIEFFTQEPSRYLGLDANWEGGLDIAAEKWGSRPEFEFRFCKTPEDMLLGQERFDCSFAMETLEHVPPDLVSPYLESLADATKHLLFVTVPNEIGIVFLAKHFTKRALKGNFQKFAGPEYLYAALGMTDKVERNEHKGFNYRDLHQQLQQHFEILEFSGHPISFLPPYLNFGVGFVCRPI